MAYFVHLPFIWTRVQPIQPVTLQWMKAFVVEMAKETARHTRKSSRGKLSHDRPT